MMINRRRVYGGGKSLPYDAEIEYLESSGTQWIDMGETSVPFYKVEVDFYTIGYGWILKNGITQIGLDNSRYGTTTLNCKYSTVLNFNGGYIFTNLNNNVTYTNGGDPTRDCGCLFRMEGYGSPSAMRIYKCFFYDNNNVPLRLLIPVRIGTTGYMYDIVSGELFGNSGTGDFILGPDV